MFKLFGFKEGIPNFILVIITGIVSLILVFVFNDSAITLTPRDIIIVAGQSNAEGYSLGYNPELDPPDKRVFQFPSYGNSKDEIIAAVDPLFHSDVVDTKNRIGFAMTFARMYVNAYPNRNLIIIPVAKAGTSTNNWLDDGQLNFAISQINALLAKNPTLKVRAILWHQGESDVSNQISLDIFKSNLTKILTDFRTKPIVKNTAPILVGGLLPAFIDSNPKYTDYQNVLKNIGHLVNKSFYVDSTDLTGEDPLHFDANSERELGKRYFEIYQKYQESKPKLIQVK